MLTDSCEEERVSQDSWVVDTVVTQLKVCHLKVVVFLLWGK